MYFCVPGAGVESSKRMIGGWGPTRTAFSAICALLLLSLLVPAAVAQTDSDGAATKSTAKSSSSSSSKKPSGKHSSHKKKTVRAKGQQKIDSERAQEIQEALIREHYMTGTATGTWNQASEEAMRRYQADHGWQSKTVPDSRALIKLGLGPSKDHLLNPESAMTTVPDAPRSQSAAPTSHSAPADADPVTPAGPASTPATSNSSSPQ